MPVCSTHVTCAMPPLTAQDRPYHTLPGAQGSEEAPQLALAVHLVAPCVPLNKSSKAWRTEGHTLPDTRLPDAASAGHLSHASTTVGLHALHALVGVFQKKPEAQDLGGTGGVVVVFFLGFPGAQPR